MPARIVIISGPEADREFQIEKTVLRVGSRDDCDLRLIDVEPHVATLRFIDGRYTILNRSGRPVSIGDKVATTGGSVAWNNGEILELGPNIAGRLIVEGDPTPTKIWTEEVGFGKLDEEFEEKYGVVAASKSLPQEPTPSSETSKNTKLVELAVIGACVVLLPLILVFGRSQSAPLRDEQAVQTEFDELTKELSGRVQSQSDLGRDGFLLDLFESARASELRQDFSRAKARYREIRDQFADRIDGTSLEARVLRFSLLELETLEREHSGE